MISEKITHCRICESVNLEEILDLGRHVPANSLREKFEKKDEAIELKLVMCGYCKTVQLSETVDPAYLFNQYVWVTGTSSTARAYAEVFCSKLLDKLENKNPFVIEIASNDGTFLKEFQSQNCKVLGIDPAKNIADLATSAGVPTISSFFDENLAREIVEKGKADAVFARNVIPHVKEVHSIIKGMKLLLADDGIGAIEFHHSQVILDELHYDSIYHEHLFYFSVFTLENLLRIHDLYPFDITDSPISGGSKVIYFSHQLMESSASLSGARSREEKIGTNTVDRWKMFARDCELHAQKLREVVIKNAPLMGYGSSARSSTMLGYSDLHREHIPLIIDKNPIKQNLYTATDAQIISYEKGLEILMQNQDQKLLLLAWNFESEIVRDLRSSGFKGQIIIPLPTIRIDEVC